MMMHLRLHAKIFVSGMWRLCRFAWFAFRHRRARAFGAPLKPRQREGLRLAFVTPWYGAGIGGGAAAEARRLITSLRQKYPEIGVEVLTTTLREFSEDWNKPAHPAGLRTEDGVAVRRFMPTTPNRETFHFLNGTYLMPAGIEQFFTASGRPRSPIPPWAEAYFLWHMVHSPDLLDYLVRERDNYDCFVFIPYMFASSVLGGIAAGRKAVHIPCFHEERYVFLRIYRTMVARAGAFLFHVRAEQEFARRVFDLGQARQCLLGEQVDVDAPAADPERFRRKFGIKTQFLLYAGSQIAGKNLPLLVEYYKEFRRKHPEIDLGLVLIGKGDLDYSGVAGVTNLGFLDAPDKNDAYAAALALCQPSLNESFSIVMMEAWLQQTPVIASQDCAVTRNHCEDSGGGLAVGSYDEFADAVTGLLNDPSRRAALGKAGREYVLRNYSPEIVTKRFVDFIRHLARETG